MHEWMNLCSSLVFHGAILNTNLGLLYEINPLKIMALKL